VVLGGLCGRADGWAKSGWTTRSSQLYENRLLRLGSPLFHFGILLVVLGDIGGVLYRSRDTQLGSRSPGADGNGCDDPDRYAPRRWSSTGVSSRRPVTFSGRIRTK
jgi:hypothetical protein